MSIAEAAKILGCHYRHVGNLVRWGTLKGKRVGVPTKNPTKIVWELDPKSVKEYAKKRQTTGFPRGNKRGSKKDK